MIYLFFSGLYVIRSLPEGAIPEELYHQTVYVNLIYAHKRTN